MKGKIVALVLLLLVIEAAFIFALYYFTNQNNSPGSGAGKCDYSNPSKIYIKQTTPCVINFLCTSDRVAFSDECGCGCRLK